MNASCLVLTLLALQSPERAAEAATLAVEVLARQNPEAPADAGPDRGAADAGPDEVVDAGPTPAQLEAGRRARAEQLARLEAEAFAEEALRAQREAIEKAENARTVALERALSQVAALEGLKASVGNHKALLHENNAALIEAVAVPRAAAQAAVKRARSLERGPEADALLDEVLADQLTAIGSTRDALRRRETLSVDEYRRQLDALPSLEPSRDPEVQAARKDRDETRAEVEASLLEVERLEQRAWLEVADQRIEVARLYDEARLLSMARVTRPRGRELRGVTNVARANLTVALGHLALAVRFHLIKRVHDFREISTLLRDEVAIANLAWAFTKLLGVVLFGVWMWRKVPDLYDRVRKTWLGSGRSRARLRVISGLLALIEDVGPTLALLAVWTFGYRTISPLGPMPEVRIVFEIAVWVLLYQVVAKLTHRLVLRLVRRRHSLNSRAKLKILRTVRTVMRYAFVAVWILSTLRELVGAGVLYSSARAATFTGLLLVFLLLVRKWREEIVGTYLDRWPNTRLAGLIVPRRERTSGIVLAVFALVVVSGRAVVLLARDFVLGFDQTRKALAYVFRARIERSARERGHHAVNIEDLPEAVRSAFADEPCANAAHLVPRFDGMKPLLDDEARGRPFTALLHGPAGIGRTTWIDQLSQALQSPQVRLAVSSRVLTERRLAQVLGAALELDEATSCDAVTAHLLAHPTTVIVDGLEWLFLRGLGGYDALDAFLHLIEETRGTTSWLVSTSAMSRRYLSRARGLEEHFTTRIELGPWKEAEIKDLIDRRQRTSGLEVSFQDLMVGDDAAMVDTSQVVETRAGYVRLLWNFAEGNPRVCQYFWLRSLRPGPDGLHVQLYEAPAADDLEALGDLDRFLLQAVALHRALVPAELARACNVPIARAEAHVFRGLASGLYRRVAKNRIEITTAWWEATVRYLRRKNLG